MKIKELKLGMKEVEIEVTVDYLPKQTRNYSYGQDTRYRQTYVVDEDGDEIKLTFWGELGDKIKEGDKIRLTHGFVTEFRGELQLNYPENHPPEIVK